MLRSCSDEPGFLQHQVRQLCNRARNQWETKQLYSPLTALGQQWPLFKASCTVQVVTCTPRRVSIRWLCGCLIQGCDFRLYFPVVVWLHTAAIWWAQPVNSPILKRRCGIYIWCGVRCLPYPLQGLLDRSVLCAMSPSATAPNQDGLLQQPPLNPPVTWVTEAKQRWAHITSKIRTSSSKGWIVLCYSAILQYFFCISITFIWMGKPILSAINLARDDL